MEALPAPRPGDPVLGLEYRVEGRRAVLVLSGEFDLAGEPAARRAMHAAMTGSSAEIVLDMRKLVFMDFGGARWLHHARRAAVHVGKDLTLVPSDAVRRVLDLYARVDRR